jgi:hypothetical protein
MKVVVVSIDFEKKKVLDTWFSTGKSPARDAEIWLQMSGSQLTRYEHHVFADEDALAAQEDAILGPSPFPVEELAE